MDQDYCCVSGFQLVIRAGDADEIFANHRSDQTAWERYILERCFRNWCTFNNLNFPDLGIALGDP